MTAPIPAGAFKLSPNIGKVTKTANALSRLIGGAVASITFGLPALKTCPGAGECRRVCFATAGRYGTATVSGARQHNFDLARAWLKSGGVEALAGALAMALTSWAFSVPYQAVYLVRLHDSGDLFSQDYADAWAQAASVAGADIAARMKGARLVVYGYTKSYAAKSPITAPSPLRMIQSAGTIDDTRIDWDRPVAVILPKSHPADDPAYVIDDDTDIPALLAVAPELDPGHDPDNPGPPAVVGLRYHGTAGGGRSAVTAPLVTIAA